MDVTLNVADRLACERVIDRRERTIGIASFEAQPGIRRLRLDTKQQRTFAGRLGAVEITQTKSNLGQLAKRHD
jgi:hypothetical protein